ncbi:TonB-dependent receptor [Pararobbsia silviterrae]|uniref:TonB-dependent receptor n=1 Tax=Pararobbsia silviterrae TaxID=1792498 RepID=A0A494XDP5_9BURK|nr:TonB-dependent receptor [Pararobbsia silviterrae]RKP46586.1 TonB-dependent receptor [Pararobbsia silviterrae]
MRTPDPVRRAVALLVSMSALTAAAARAESPAITAATGDTSNATPAASPDGWAAPGANTQSAADAASAGRPASVANTANAPLDVEINATKLDRARNGLSPDTGSSVYTIDAQAIDTMPAGQNTSLNQVLLQAPGVVQDSYGQLHVRGDHADLQYRIDGILIPEAISGFGQAIDTHIANSVSLLTGALPAQYGYRTAGVVDIQTKGASAGDGGDIGVYGGSHGTLDYDATVYGTRGALTYFFTGSLNQNNLGIEAPTSDGSPLHDFTRQASGFGYLSYLLNPLTRVNLMFGTSTAHFELPNTPGLTPQYALAGHPDFDSANLDENQYELNEFAAVSLQGTNGDALDYQIALFTRYTRTQFNPDPIGDLIFNGVASQDYHNNVATGAQTDLTYRLTPTHTLRFGGYVEQEHATFRDAVSVFPADSAGNQTSDVPFSIQNESGQTGHLYSLYVQDEWKPVERLTINYGLRYDRMDEYVSASQLSPRLGLVFDLTPTTILHAGYARYFTPPAFELVNSGTIAQFEGTTNQQPNTLNDAVKPERSHTFDLGVTQQFGPHLSVGLDAYYKIVTDLLDEGQFGTALIYTPFNYARGRVMGAELTANYHDDPFSAYVNLTYSHAQGTDIESAQFNIDAATLAYAANNWINLDHDQMFTGSAGARYRWNHTTFTSDLLFGSGLRSGFANTDHLPFYTQVNLGVIQQFNEPYVGPVTIRLAVINLFNRVYELRDGSGIGVEAPQYGPQRAFYAGLSKSF